MVENLNLKKILNPQIQESQQTLNTRKTNNNKIASKRFLRISQKQLKKNGTFHTEEKIKNIFLLGAMQARTQWRNIIKIMKERIYQPKILY